MGWKTAETEIQNLCSFSSIDTSVEDSENKFTAQKYKKPGVKVFSFDTSNPFARTQPILFFKNASRLTKKLGAKSLSPSPNDLLTTIDGWYNSDKLYVPSSNSELDEPKSDVPVPKTKKRRVSKK